MLTYDPITRQFLNEAAQPHESETTYDGKPTEAFFDRMFSEGYASNNVRSLSAVWACMYVLSSAIGLMPFRLYRNNGESTEEERTHRTAGLLRDAPGPSSTWTEMRESIMMQILSRGNAHTQNFFKRGYLDEAFLWDEDTTRAEPLRGSRKAFYSIGANEFGVTPRNYFPPEISHFRGVRAKGLHGISPIEQCKNALGSASATARQQKLSAEKGGPLKGIITGVEPFRNTELANQVRARWAQAFKKAQGDSGVPIFEGSGMKFNPISMSNQDAQFIELMRFSIEDIARIFNLPPHQIQHLERATNNNIDLLNQEYYKSSLLPWNKRISEVATRTWLTTSDRRAGLYIACDPAEFLQADLEKWTKSLAAQVGGGLRQPNEARSLLNLPPVEHGDTLRVPSNTVPVGYDPATAQGTPTQPPENPPA